MSLKAEIETWVDALNAYDAEDFEKALDLFQRIADSSKILTNIGLIYATLGEHELAVEHFNLATKADQFLAVAYFQCGVSNFLMNRFDLAYKDFEEAYLYLRGNEAIKYEQLGLKFNLYSAEVLFNRGLAQLYMNRINEGVADMEMARKEKVTPEHDVIDDAIRDQGEGYTVFSIPVGILYRPAENKVKNTKAKDYLGKAKLVAATDSRDMGTGFSGLARREAGMTPSGAPLDGRPLPAAAPRKPKPQNDDPPPRLERTPTQIKPAQPSENAKAGIGRADSVKGQSIAALGGGPTRSLSIRKADTNGNGAPPPPVPNKAPPPATRLTEIYDDYIGFDDSEPPPPLPPVPADANARVANWAQKVPSGGAPMSSRAPSVRMSMRRKPTRRSTAPRLGNISSAPPSTAYEEEEEGYGSAEYDEGFELVKIRVKLHYRDDVRGMAISPEMPFEEFAAQVAKKFGRRLGMKFREEDGAMVSLMDESDFDLAVETARESARGRPEGKLEVWCDDA